MISCFIAFFCAVCILFGGDIYAQKRTYSAERIPGGRPDIDGEINDPVWQNGSWDGDFIQFEPYNGIPAVCKTEFKLFYDNDNIFIAVKAFDTDPDEVVARTSRRDAWEGDLIEIHFDSYMDSRTSFVFSVNAAGSIGDNIISDDGKEKDLNWDPVWEGDAERFENGWTAEMRIPFSQLRFDGKGEQVWGFQIVRWVHRTQEFTTWQPVTKDEPGWVSPFGRLRGINGIEPSKRIEIIPYTVDKYSDLRSEKDNPLYSGDKNSVLAGLDGKIGLTNDFNLDLTINPDFGQVEADPSEINLTAFESFFPEKRQFFAEGTSIFNFPAQDYWLDKLFHSRRIGKAPSYLPQTGQGEYIRIPETTSILGAAKLSGKTKSGLSIGLLESVTSRESADYHSGDTVTKIDVEPMTNFFTGRIQKDYNNGNMTIGGIATAVNRNIRKEHLDFLTKSAYTAGFDLMKMWNDKEYSFIFRNYGSRISGSKEAISAAQRSSMRYFQRPDAQHVEYDPDRTSLSGYGGSIALEKLKKGHWSGKLFVIWRSPGLELNDIGYLKMSDFRMYSVYVNYREWEPESIYNNYNIGLNLWYSTTFGNEKQLNGGRASSFTQFKNFWSLSTALFYEGEEFNPGILRGGSALLRPAHWGTNLSISSDIRKNLVFNINYDRTIGNYNYRDNTNYSGGITWNPNRTIYFSFEPAYQKSYYELQYLNSFTVNSSDRYLLGTINRETFYLTTRFYYNITPNLTVQYYGMPFIGSGDYSGFKYADDLKSSDYEKRFHLYSPDEINYDDLRGIYTVDEDDDNVTDYEFANPDFNFFQLRSNLVVRWEYSPGSTLYLVWTQNRTGGGHTGIFRLRDGFEDLFGLESDNVFLVKVSKWFSL